MQGVSIPFRFTCATFVLCVLSFGSVFGQGGETFSYPRSGASGIWTEVSGSGSRSLGIDENGQIVDYEEASDLESLASEPGFGVFSSLRVFGEARANVSSHTLFRGQVVPPTESPTSSTTISATDVSAASSNVSTPPPPTTGSTTNEETTFQRVFKNSQDFSASITYITGSKTPEVGKSSMRNMEIDARILFACPCGCSSVNNGYFLVTPSFKYTGLETYTGYSTTPVQKEQEEAEYYIDVLRRYLNREDVSDEVYSASASRVYKEPFSLYDFGVTGTVKTTLRDLEVYGDLTLGMASSFKNQLTCDSFYVRGRLVGELPVTSTKESKIVGGAAYYGRIRYKVLPILGLVWNPNPQNEFRLIYPNPRWSHFLTKVNGTDWWFYIHGELGGGTWFFKDKKYGKFQLDNNDYRVGLGVTFDCSSNLMGSAEIGGAFGRELRTKNSNNTANLPIKDAFYFKFGLLF